MQIILQEDVEKLGTRGQVLEVAAGYARNYLLPRKLAIEATASNRKHLEKLKATLAKRTATERDAAQKQAEALNSVSVRFARKAGENDQLFGSVTAADIAEALNAQKYKVDKKQIHLAEAIKIIGEYQVTVKLYQEISANVKVVHRAAEFPHPPCG
jgi:large subunit ribosomal protein L9